jgi:hypothetical protein
MQAKKTKSISKVKMSVLALILPELQLKKDRAAVS